MSSEYPSEQTCCSTVAAGSAPDPEQCRRLGFRQIGVIFTKTTSGRSEIQFGIRTAISSASDLDCCLGMDIEALAGFAMPARASAFDRF